MSLVSVWDELWAIIADDPDELDSLPVAALTEIRRVYKGEPVVGYELSGTWIAITPAGYSEEVWQFWLRIYSVIAQRPIENQIAVATTIDQLEALLDENVRFERGDWETGANEALSDWVATIQLRGPRE